MRRVEQFSALGQKDRLAIFRLLVRAGPQGNCVDDIKRRLMNFDKQVRQS
jgi:hypothetical protein